MSNRHSHRKLCYADWATSDQDKSVERSGNTVTTPWSSRDAIWRRFSDSWSAVRMRGLPLTEWWPTPQINKHRRIRCVWQYSIASRATQSASITIIPCRSIGRWCLQCKSGNRQTHNLVNADIRAVHSWYSLRQLTSDALRATESTREPIDVEPRDVHDAPCSIWSATTNCVRRTPPLAPTTHR